MELELLRTAEHLRVVMKAPLCSNQSWQYVVLFDGFTTKKNNKHCHSHLMWPDTKATAARGAVALRSALRSAKVAHKMTLTLVLQAINAYH